MAKSAAFKIALDGTIGLRDVTALTAQFREALAKHSDIVVTTNGLTGIDITVLQLLVAARKSAMAAGKSLALEAPAAPALELVLVKAGFLSATGEATTPDGDFWTHATK